MTPTGIYSDGTVYFAGRKTWATGMFHVVFECFVSGGSQMPDGIRADPTCVWLSEWLLESINYSHLLPVALETYWQLQRHIARPWGNTAPQSPKFLHLKFEAQRSRVSHWSFQ